MGCGRRRVSGDGGAFKIPQKWYLFLIEDLSIMHGFIFSFKETDLARG